MYNHVEISLSFPKDVHTRTPGSYEDVLLHGKRDFANVNEVTDFKIGRLS